MTATSLFLQVGLIVTFGVYACSGTRGPAIWLYKAPDSNSTVRFREFGGHIPDLSTYDFNDAAYSYLLHATVILYEDINYNDDDPNANIITMTYLGDNSTETRIWFNATHPQLPLTSSVRVLGAFAGYTHFPTVELFEKNNFAGLGSESVRRSQESFTGSNFSSMVNIGVKDWTFYDEVNYGGKGDCVRGSRDEFGVKFLGSACALGFDLSAKQSVEEGCFSRHGVPVDD